MRRSLYVSMLVFLVGSLLGGVASAQEPPAAAAIDAEPEEASNVITTGHTVTATATDENGDPVAGAPVFWSEDGAGEIVEADATTDENGEARAVTTSREIGDQTIVASLDPDTAACDEATEEEDPRCDAVLKHWTDGPFGNAALECSGGGYALNSNLAGPFAEIPNEEVPCPPAGSEDDPTVQEESVIGVPADPAINAQVLYTKRTFSSTGATTESSATQVVLLDTLEIDVVDAFASSQCDDRGVASQELSGGVVTIRDATTGAVIFQGAAPPNTELDLSPVARIVLNEQDPEGGTVGPELPGEVQDRHAEGSVTAVHVELLADNIDVEIAHAESDVTCKQHAFTIDLEPEEATNRVGTEHTVTATVIDEAGRPVVGEQVQWTEDGPGDFVSAEESTDSNGQADAVVTSNEAGDQTITASLDPESTKCGEEGGVCSDSVVKHWEAEPGPTMVSVRGAGHTTFERRPTLIETHVGLNIADDTSDQQPPTVFRPVLYADERADPPGPATGPFVCDQGIPQQVTIVAANEVVIEGTIDCTGHQHGGSSGDLPQAVSFRLRIVDHGPNPPNQDQYRMTLFDGGGNVVYDYGDFTTVGRRDLRIETS